MRAKNRTLLTPRQRLTRGLAYTAVGPLDVTRGVVGLGLHSAQAGASNLHRRYREGRAAQSRRRSRQPWMIAGCVLVALAGGAVAFSITRRSSLPEPSPRPPSVEVQPRP
jgi:hypothetical protein